MPSEHGQATLEWTGLVLLAALGMAAVTSLLTRVDGRGLGESVAHAITCAAGGGCPARPPPERPSPPSRSAAPAEVPAGRPGVSPARAAAALQALRGAAGVAEKIWILCLGYRRYRYEVEHPRLPMEAMPLEEALDIANECVNPLGFLAPD